MALGGFAERHFRHKDPEPFVLDEVAGMLVAALSLTKPPLHWCAAAFALFRWLDIKKPFGIARLQRFKGGIGIAADDLAAGALALAIVQVSRFLVSVGGRLSPRRSPGAPAAETTRDSGVRRASGESQLSPGMSQTGMSLTWAFVLSVGFAVALAAVAASFLNFRFAKEATITALDDAGTSAAAYASNKDPASWEPRAQGAFTLHGVTVQPVKIQRRGESVEGMVYRGTKQDSTGAVTTYDILVDSPIQEFGRSFALSLLVTSVVIVGVGIGVAFLLSRRHRRRSPR